MRWTGAPSSLAIRIPIPISIEKTINASTLTSAMTCTGLLGMALSSVSRQSMGLGSGMEPMSIADVSTPSPGLINVPRPRPNHTAIWPLTTNRSIARQPTLPSFFRSPMLATPATRLKKISGTTSILMKAMKTSPIILMLSASGPHSRPTITPKISAAITRCHSGIANQAFMSAPLLSLLQRSHGDARVNPA